jgi:thiol:disulfide interchange protein DsbD
MPASCLTATRARPRSWVSGMKIPQLRVVWCMPKLLKTSVLLLGLLLSQMGLGQFDGTPRKGIGLDAALRNEPVPLEQAFPYYVSILNPERLRVTWDIAPGHYLYRHAFEFSLQLHADAESTPITFELPEGEHKTDQFFGEIEAYYGSVKADVSLPASDFNGAVLIIQYQGCAEWGFCYPPQRQEFPLSP